MLSVRRRRWRLFSVWDWSSVRRLEAPSTKSAVTWFRLRLWVLVCLWRQFWRVWCCRTTSKAPTGIKDVSVLADSCFMFFLKKETIPASIYKALKIPGVLLASFSIIVTSMSIGFLQATLEPHLRQFALSPIVLGLMFVINGGTYAVTAPAWGWLCDKNFTPKVITVIGTVLVAAGFSLVGPAPFIPTNT